MLSLTFVVKMRHYRHFGLESAVVVAQCLEDGVNLLKQERFSRMSQAVFGGDASVRGAGFGAVLGAEPQTGQQQSTLETIHEY